MNVKEEKICRLCLKVAENEVEIIDEITRNMFEVLRLRVNLDISDDPVICKDCSEVVVKCFNFKSAFIDSKEHVFSFAIEKDRATFEMKNVYKDGKGIETVDDNFLCRFCSNHLSTGDFVLLDTLTKDVTFAEMLQQLMPDTDFNIIKNPVICTSCTQDLECYIKFVKNCLNVEEKIAKYFQSEGAAFSGQVKLSEILCFLNKNVLELDYTQMCAIKQEEDPLEDVGETQFEGYDCELIKSEEEIDIKDEEVNFSEIACKTSSDTPVYILNGLKSEIGKATKTLIDHSPFTSTQYRKCMCDTIHHYCIKCDVKSNMISSETGNAKLYQTKYKMVNKITYQRLGSKNSSEAIHKNMTEMEMYKCAKCTYETNRMSSLRSHMLIHKDITEVEMYKCSMCAYQAKHKNSLKIHMLIHKDITEVEMYKCSTCTYQAKQKSHLKTHILIHKDITEVETYKCSICTYETKYKRSLKAHMLIHKDIGEIEMYKCSMCTYQAKQKGSLKRHVLIHKDITEVEMYKCSKCTYQAKQKSQLKTHMLIHKDITEVKMYKCSMCTYETKHKSGLKRHMLIHKDFTEVETYKCSMCTYETKQKCSLKRHILIHKDITEMEMYKCSMCTYQAKQKSQLKTHMLIHKDITEVEMYKCSMCTFETKLKGGLKVHMLIHKNVTEVEMYKCSMCTHETKRKDSLKRHILTHGHYRSGNV